MTSCPQETFIGNIATDTALIETKADIFWLSMAIAMNYLKPILRSANLEPIKNCLPIICSVTTPVSYQPAALSKMNLPKPKLPNRQ